MAMASAPERDATVERRGGEAGAEHAGGDEDPCISDQATLAKWTAARRASTPPDVASALYWAAAAGALRR